MTPSWSSAPLRAPAIMRPTRLRSRKALAVGPSAVAAWGNTGGVAVPTTVFPFILRGVSLLGIDSVQCPIERRRAVWARLAGDLRPSSLDALGTDEVELAEVPAALARILDGGARGRTLVRVS